ncbi:hypothetical protein Tco_1431815 [Tanacetum coccineum]
MIFQRSLWFVVCGFSQSSLPLLHRISTVSTTFSTLFSTTGSIDTTHRFLANVLEELFSSVNYPEMQELGILLDKIRNPEEWNIIMTPAERAEVLLAIRQVASSLSSMGRTPQISRCL